MRHRIAQQHRMKGWGFSLILHTILLSAIVPAFRHLPAPTYREPFRWNVTFVESPQQTPPDEPDSKAPIEKTFPPASKVASVSRPSTQTMRGSAHVAEGSGDTRPRSTTPPPTPIAQPQPEVSSQTLSTMLTTPITHETLPGDQPSTNMSAPLIRSDPSMQSIALIEQELLSAPASSTTDTAMAPTQPLNTAPVSSPPALPVVSDRPPAPQADYSWLQQAVSRRLEELKRLSRPSLDDSNKLKVLVKAVVSNTGELMEAEVVKSSGLDRIDQEAMRLVQRAFPMLLDHTLDRQQIVMRIPITYSRD